MISITRFYADTKSKQPNKKQNLDIMYVVRGYGFAEIMAGSSFSWNEDYFENAVIIPPRFWLCTWVVYHNGTTFISSLHLVVWHLLQVLCTLLHIIISLPLCHLMLYFYSYIYTMLSSVFDHYYFFSLFLVFSCAWVILPLKFSLQWPSLHWKFAVRWYPILRIRVIRW